MKKQVSAADFYTDRGIAPEAGTPFNVFKNEVYCTEPHLYNRRDFYKISLLLGSSRLSWHHQEIDINRPALVFYNPLTPYAWEPLSTDQPGFFCVFKKEFLNGNDRNESLQNSPLFKPGNNPVRFLDNAQVKYIRDIFTKMLVENGADYLYKDDLLRTYLHLIIHEALKMEPGATSARHKNAAERISTLFFELLERQFPIDSPEHLLQLKTAGDYAQALSVHVNHLNHALQETTGKPTSAHIADRIVAEAKALLKHTDWPVATIASSLGFEYPNYFYNFFKKKTGHSPKLTRLKTI